MKKKDQTKPLVYVGPSFPDGSLRAYTVFRGVLPQTVKSIIENNPRLELLFVDPIDLPVASRRIRTKGDALNTVVLSLIESFKRGN